MVVTEVPRH